MNIEIPEIDWDDPGPGWIPIVEAGTHKPLKPVIKCQCGVWCGIGLHHVHADGTVTASFYHAHSSTGLKYSSPDGCGWHVFLKLKNYTKGEFPPEKAKE